MLRLVIARQTKWCAWRGSNSQPSDPKCAKIRPKTLFIGTSCYLHLPTTSANVTKAVTARTTKSLVDISLGLQHALLLIPDPMESRRLLQS